MQSLITLVRCTSKINYLKLRLVQINLTDSTRTERMKLHKDISGLHTKQYCVYVSLGL